MNAILLPNKEKLHLDNRIQVGSKGREFMARGCEKDLSKPPMWRTKQGVNVECYCWIFTFRYLDNQKEGFRVFVDVYDNYDGIEHF